MPRSGTGFVNLSTLLGLNGDAIEQAGGQLLGDVRQNVSSAQGALDRSYDAWRGQATGAGGSGTGWGDWNDQNQQDARAYANRAAEQVEASKTAGGRSALVERRFGSAGGNSRLDGIMLGSSNSMNAAPYVYGSLSDALRLHGDDAAAHTAGLDAQKTQAQMAAEAARKERQRELLRTRPPNAPAAQRRTDPYGRRLRDGETP